jgi:prolyl-tRNA synthetase
MAKEITSRSENYSQWYNDIVLKAQLADYAPVRGCMIIRPNGFAIWEKLQAELDRRIKSTGVGGRLHKNAYFPLFIPESYLAREAEHVEGFVPECAVVTHGGGKELEEKLYVRPTSETIMYEMYSKWISSYRDLPLLINQWCNIVRWEQRTRLFLRTLEFLWQEGHTAHATHEEALEETLMILNDVYADTVEKVMAIPVLRGKKTESQRFPGAVDTYCIEALMQDGKALQMGTSHDLGQNFAKVFNVRFQDKDGELKYVWQTSWGVSTRLVGALIMAHSDDKGLVLPPELAPTQVVIVPIYKSDEDKQKVLEAADNVKKAVAESGISVELDAREEFKPGYKFYDWEMKGVPLRIEIGPRDVSSGQVVLARRDSGEKSQVPIGEAAGHAEKTLGDIQKGLYEKAKKFLDEHTYEVNAYEELKKITDEAGGFVWAPWCGNPDCEQRIQDETKATIRLVPFDAPDIDTTCVACTEAAKMRVPFAKAY